MVFTELALWTGMAVDSPCPSVCVSVTLRHLSHVTCQMSPITCNVSNDLFYDIFFSIKKNYKKKYIFFFSKLDRVVDLVGGGSVINVA